MSDLRLALRMLLRDARAGELQLLCLAIVVAVASLTSVGFLADRVGRTLEREANQLLGGDLLLRADRPWPDSVAAQARSQALAVTGSVLFTSMVSTAEQVQLAGVKAVGEGYPLRGELRVSDGPNRAERRAGAGPAPGEVWLDERLFTALGVRQGDLVGLGLREFRVAAMLTYESDRGSNFFSLLPRALFNQADLAASGLLTEGARATYRLHLAGPPEAVAAFERWVQPRLARGQAIENLGNARPQVRAALDQAQRFLKLAALLAVILAAVAVGLSSRRFMLRHLDACAVMRCLGACQRKVLRLYSLEFLLLGLLAATVGVLIGWGGHSVLAGILAAALGSALPPVSFLPALQGLLVGVLLLLGFALPQILALGRVPTLRVLRRDWAGVSVPARGAWAAGALSLGLLVFWVAEAPRLGAWVAGGFALALGGFALLARLAIGWACGRHGRAALGGGWRYGLASLRRRMGASVLQVTALGVGLMALLLLTFVQADLIGAWRSKTPADAPNRFIINIQPDQADGLRSRFTQAGLPPPLLQPMIRGRLTHINAVPVSPAQFEQARAKRLSEREFNLSFGTGLPTGNDVVAGRWHAGGDEAAWSVEAGLAETFALKLGDRVRFEVAGQQLEAPITSVRKLDWDSMQVNFFFIASPALLGAQPATLITSFYLDRGRQPLLDELVRTYPNLTVIDVTAILHQIEKVMTQLIEVVRFVFGFALLAGLVVLYAALQATHDEREYELAMLRTLGARNRQVRDALLAEFVALGGIAGALAGLGAVAAGWALAVFVFKLPYVPSPWPLAMGIGLGAAGVALAGWLGVRGLLGRAPLASLRALA